MRDANTPGEADGAPRNALLRWIDDRTGYKHFLHEALNEPVQGGARWRYVFGSALTAAFLIQLVTGLFLMMSYSPSATTAWGSVYYISYQMNWGWFLRGIHHFGSQAMVILLALHLIQVLIAGAYRAPREFNWWFGMLLLLVTLGLSLTGYLLPWDQKGYWATKVATNIMGGAPGLGPYIQKIVVGGADYGNQTLTRFYGLHVGVLPGALILLLVIHIALFRRHGVTYPKNSEAKVEDFWPKQVGMDTIASFLVLAAIVGMVLWEGGANLDAPADPSSSDYPARPEWYFLSLFQMLKLFPGDREVIGTVVVPSAILAVLFLLPLFDKVLPRGLAHFLACSFVFALLGGAGYLTVSALREDAANAQFQKTREAADATRHRALALAGNPDVGIPPSGAGYLLRNDPLTHGRAVLTQRCLSCHHYEGQGQIAADGSSSPQTASDLAGVTSKDWVRGLLEDPAAPKYFGTNQHLKGMKSWKKSKAAKAYKPQDLDALADLVGQFAKVEKGVEFADWFDAQGEALAKHPAYDNFVKDCGKCHVVGDPGTMTDGGFMDAPNLFGYGSRQWLTRMIHDPGDPELYGFLDPEAQMPPFGAILSENDTDMLIRFLRGEYPK